MLTQLCFMCQFGFRKWKSHVTERPFEERSDVVKELYSDLKVVKPHSGPGTVYLTCLVCKIYVDGRFGTCYKELITKEDNI